MRLHKIIYSLLLETKSYKNIIEIISNRFPGIENFLVRLFQDFNVHESLQCDNAFSRESKIFVELIRSSKTGNELLYKLKLLYPNQNVDNILYQFLHTATEESVIPYALRYSLLNLGGDEIVH